MPGDKFFPEANHFGIYRYVNQFNRLLIQRRNFDFHISMRIMMAVILKIVKK